MASYDDLGSFFQQYMADTGLLSHVDYSDALIFERSRVAEALYGSPIVYSDPDDLAEGYLSMVHELQSEFPDYIPVLGPVDYPIIGDKYIIAIGLVEEIVDVVYLGTVARVYIHVPDFPHSAIPSSLKYDYVPTSGPNKGQSVPLSFFAVTVIAEAVALSCPGKDDLLVTPFSVEASESVEGCDAIPPVPHYYGVVSSGNLFVLVGNSIVLSYRTTLKEGDLTLGLLKGREYVVDYVGRSGMSSSQILSNMKPLGCLHGYRQVASELMVSYVPVDYYSGRIRVSGDYSHVASLVVEPVFCKLIKFGDRGPTILSMEALVLFVSVREYVVITTSQMYPSTEASPELIALIKTDLITTLRSLPYGVYIATKLAGLSVRAIGGGGFSPRKAQSLSVSANLMDNIGVFRRNYPDVKTSLYEVSFDVDTPPSQVLVAIVRLFKLFGVSHNLSDFIREYGMCDDWPTYEPYLHLMELKIIGESVQVQLPTPPVKNNYVNTEIVTNLMGSLKEAYNIVRFGRIYGIWQMLMYDRVPGLKCDRCQRFFRAASWIQTNSSKTENICVRCFDSHESII